DDLKKMIDQQVDEMRKQALEQVKKEIFDWTPTDDPPATADRGLFSSLFGGASVSLKKSTQVHAIHLPLSFDLNGTLAIGDTKAGTLEDLQPALRSNLDKYLVYVDIGRGFQKIQVVAKPNISWSDKLPDGADLSDPVKSVSVEVEYPDFTT